MGQRNPFRLGRLYCFDQFTFNQIMTLIAISFANQEDAHFGVFFINPMPAVPREGDLIWLDSMYNPGFEEDKAEALAGITWVIAKVGWGRSNGEYFAQLFLERNPEDETESTQL